MARLPAFGLRLIVGGGMLALVSGYAATAIEAPVSAATEPSEPAKRIMLPRSASSKKPAVLSLLNIRKRMRHGEFSWDESGVPDGPVWVRVDLANQMISVFRAGHEIGTAVILYGAQEKPTPVGTFEILEMRKDHRSNLYDAAMPYMLRLSNDGIAIHGSDVRLGFATHGCVGVPEEFARLLFGQVKRGDQVVVLREDSTPSRV